MASSPTSPALNAVADQLVSLAGALRSPKLVTAVNSSTVRTSAALAALFMVLWYYSSEHKEAKKGKGSYVTDFSKIAQRVKQAGEHEVDEYDVIIIGGGTAGCVLASRLSEDPSIRVLLLEAGRSAKKLPFAQIPSAYSNFFYGGHEWGLSTEKQIHAGGKQEYWPRAKLLGGCSNMNALMYHYGAPSDYDEWVQLQKGQPGASGWSYKEFHPYFLKFERFNPSHQFPEVDATLRGSQGVVDFGHNGHFAKLTAMFIEACKATGLSHSHDVNTHKGPLGVTKVLTYIDRNSRRVTTETAYLNDEVLSRPNLTVATNATVTRILFDRTAGNIRSTGVEFANKQGNKFQAKAVKEVVLAAGTVHTPHILMLSGVGPASHLSSLDIPVVADLPGVGSNLKDHAVIDLGYMDKSKSSLNFLRPSTCVMRLQFVKAVLQYQLTGKGPLTTNVAEGAAFIRTDDPDLFPSSEFSSATSPEDTTTGKGAPDVELFFTPTAYNAHGTERAPNDGHYNFMLHAVTLRPKSAGTIRLKSKNPMDPPVIDPNYLEDYNDVKTLIRGVRILDKIAHAEPLASVIDPAGDNHPELQHNIGTRSDEEIEQYVRKGVHTLYHPACTARMAPLEDGGVVDPLLRVHRIPNLRIVDASIFPSIVSGHTAAPVIAIAEKAADLIKADVSSQSLRK